ncbi:MAG: type II secretion system F family protein [Kiritimatiellia bacterium]|jgi:tight adherence protein C
MTLLLSITATLAWGFAIAGLVWCCGSLARQITYVTLADGRRAERKLPLSFRLLLPFAPNATPLVSGPAFARARQETDSRLASAGFDGLLSSTEFLALRILHPVVLGLGWTLLMLFFSRVDDTLRDYAGLLSLAGILLFALHPILWLRSAVRARHHSIRRALPFLLDLLTLSVEAGMDFMSALQRSVDSRPLDPLGEEVIRMSHEIQLGTSRRDALRAMGARMNLPELRSVTQALVQADELGVSIGSTLRIQADQMRQRRFATAEKLANEAPVKLLGPLMLCIFPAVFIVLLGPILSQVMGNLL